MPAVGGVAWVGALLGMVLAWPGLLALTAGGAVAVLVARRRPARDTVAALVLVLVAAAGVAVLRAQQVAENPVAELAADGAAVTAVGTVTSDPQHVAGGYDAAACLAA